MLRYLTIIVISLLLSNCKRFKNPNIETFAWIQNNLNWIVDTSDLKARYYLEYNSISDSLKFAYSRFIRINNKLNVEETNYYISKAPKGLDSMIYHTLYNKKYSQSYTHSDGLEPYIWDGDYFCIIYKFKEQSERVITYIPPNLTGSLIVFQEYLDSIRKTTKFYPTKPFDIDHYMIKYKNIILDHNPLAPPLLIDTSFIRYKPLSN
jgi:hypothetical protein